MTDLEYPPQTVRKARVRLTDKRGFDILDKKLEVHSGEPIGDWTEFLGIRIALKRIRSDVFDGIVPDFTDMLRNMVTSDQKRTSNDTDTEINNS